MKRYVLLFGIMAVFASKIAEAQFYKNVQEEIDGKTRTVMLLEMTVSPQAPTEPALKHRLHWGFDQRVKANAAVKYNMAIRELTGLRYRLLRQLSDGMKADFDRALTDPAFFKTKKDALEAFEKELAAEPESADRRRRESSPSVQAGAYSNYCNDSREKFPMEKAGAFVAGFQQAYRFLEEGSRCDYCDWEYRIRDNRSPFAILLPEIQECRELARALQVKCRFEIYEGRLDDAVQTVRVAKALARHVGESPFIIASLVAVAIDGVANSCLMELVAEPGAPNLYWPLTALPHPFLDPAGSFETELDWARLMLPELVKAMDRPDEMTDDDWKSLDKSCRAGLRAFVEADWGGDQTLPLKNFSGLVAYPYAKSWLVDEGRSPDEIDAMPVAKVVGLWSVRRYQVHRDNVLKSAFLPYWQMKRFQSEYEPKLSDAEKATPLGALSDLLFPASRAYRTAIARQAAHHEVLRVVEAIRLHAAAAGGTLPETPDEITLAPLPNDPFTGKPFDYKIRDDGAAVLEFDPGHGAFRIVVRLR